ncbi:MAG TPA: hypothetical protein VGP36_12195 [Mycobacteriales bacterium]|nr:hypothetical protein [Mycobacteriales bacterium]
MEDEMAQLIRAAAAVTAAGAGVLAVTVARTRGRGAMPTPAPAPDDGVRRWHAVTVLAKPGEIEPDRLPGPLRSPSCTDSGTA